MAWIEPNSTSGSFVELTWDGVDTWATKNFKCECLRVFKNTLIALATNEAGSYYTTRVRWSHPFEPAATPETWDEADASKLAGYYDIAETPARVVDGMALDDTFFIYKGDSVWRMQQTGSTIDGTPLVFSFSKAFDNIRILTSGCVAEFTGKHFVVTSDSVIIHNGTSVQDIANNRVRRFLFDNLNTDYLQRTHVLQVPHRSEIWIIFPSGTSQTCNKALIWNWETGAWGFRDMPNVWATDIIRPKDDSQLYLNEFSRTPFTAGNAGDIWELETVDTFDGDWPASKYERTGIVLPDWPTAIYVERMQLRMTGERPVSVQIGFQDQMNGAVTWATATSFTPSTDSEANIQVEQHMAGRYLAIRVSTDAETAGTITGTKYAPWELYGVTLDWDTEGDR
jgi:hypothetical protein